MHFKWGDLMDKAITFLTEKFLLYDKPNIIVACSGGPDSMALLNLCVQLRNRCNISLICAHVNHNVRKESASEKIFVENYCKENDIIFEYMKIDNYGDDNFESEARTKRYNYFDSLVKKYNAPYLLTAHHGDDLMETIIMRMVRGSSLKGYSGFSNVVIKNGYQILRPFVFYTKEDLIEYNKGNGVEYVLDKTNELDIHTRNRYRKYILPKLKSENANVHEKFYKFSQLLLKYDSFITNLVEEQKNKVYINNRLFIPDFLKIDEFLRIRLLENILGVFYSDDLVLISDRHVKLLNDLINSSKPNAVLYLPNGILAIKEYDYLYLKNSDCDSSGYEIELCDQVVLANGKTIKYIDDTCDNSNYVCRLNSTEVTLPLIVRNRHDGDKMTVKGMNGQKKVKDIFIDKKISIASRDVWPIVTDSRGVIVWLPGLKKSQFDKKKSEKYDIIVKYD